MGDIAWVLAELKDKISYALAKGGLMHLRDVLYPDNCQIIMNP